MEMPLAHRSDYYTRFAIAIHRVAHGRDPSRVEVGLMEMDSMVKAGAHRVEGQPLDIDGVPVVVGSLEDRVQAIR